MGGIGCDNMTAILVCFLSEQSLDLLGAKCSRPAKKVPFQDSNHIIGAEKENDDGDNNELT